MYGISPYKSRRRAGSILCRAVTNQANGAAAWRRDRRRFARGCHARSRRAARRCRDAALAERDAALAERDALLLNARLEIEKLKIQLAALRRDRYGKSSERLAAEIGQLEMLIGDLEEDQAERKAAAEKARRAKGKPDKPLRPALRRPLPAHLPRETVLHEPVLACRCGCTDTARLTRFGEDVTEVLERCRRG
jgi:hypothetical protein